MTLYNPKSAYSLWKSVKNRHISTAYKHFFITFAAVIKLKADVNR